MTRRIFNRWSASVYVLSAATVASFFQSVATASEAISIAQSFAKQRDTDELNELLEKNMNNQKKLKKITGKDNINIGNVKNWDRIKNA
jgi:hypothetical protein